MRALRSAGALAVAGMGFLLGGCAGEAPEPLTLDVGAHRVVFEAPEGWQLFDRGAEQFFKRDLDQIFLNDAGAVTVDGFRREVERARDVFRGGNLEQANDVLNAVRWRSSFPSKDRWDTFYASLTRARGLGSGREHYDPFNVESAYKEILVQLDTLPQRDIETLAMEALAEFEPVDRRTVRTQNPMIIDGRQAWLIETWDRLNHVGLARYIFVLDNGRFLVIRSGLGQFSNIEPDFEAITASLHFQ